MSTPQQPQQPQQPGQPQPPFQGGQGWGPGVPPQAPVAPQPAPQPPYGAGGFGGPPPGGGFAGQPPAGYAPAAPAPAGYAPGAPAPAGAPAAYPPAGYPPAGHPPGPSAEPGGGFFGAVAAEWTKLWSVRSTYWCLGLMAGLVLVLDLGLGVAISGRDSSPFTFIRVLIPGVLLGQLAVVPLGALSITSEYSTGLIRTTFVAAPARLRVLAAKTLVLLTVLLVLCTFCTTVGMLLSALLLPGDSTGGGAVPTGMDRLDASLGAGVFMALLGMLAYAIGTLIRHSAGSITIVLGLLFLPFILGLIAVGFSGTRPVGQKLLEYSLLDGLVAQFGVPFIGGGPGPWTLISLLAVVTALVLAGGLAATAARDA
ncbi:ABC transporter permease [Phaeacidiphilus oryzae]|uniref:ABC transporter permease n=1 Tax=Phaeacidiphilus oryzae TaxID=348818 RepID=UPI0007C78D84|nr:ABC transporter permease [Phaeacidiphilus oryzae]